MADLSVKILLDFQATEVGTGIGVVPTYEARIRKRWSLLYGTGADQVDMMFAAASDISASGSTTFDLNNAFSWPVPFNTGAWGENVDFAEMVAFFVANVDGAGDANDVDLTIGNAASAQWASWAGGADTAVGPISPGGMFMLITPDAGGLGAVVDTSADNIKIAGGAGTTSGIQYGFFGRSA